MKNKKSYKKYSFPAFQLITGRDDVQYIVFNKKILPFSDKDFFDVREVFLILVAYELLKIAGEELAREVLASQGLIEIADNLEAMAEKDAIFFYAAKYRSTVKKIAYKHSERMACLVDDEEAEDIMREAFSRGFVTFFCIDIGKIARLVSELH